jgi:hypothetical protein
VNCEEEWGFGGLRPAKEWGFADLGVCPTLPVCVLGPAMRRGELEKAEGNKGIRVSGLLNLLEKAEGNKGTVFYHFFIFFSLG